MKLKSINFLLFVFVLQCLVVVYLFRDRSPRKFIHNNIKEYQHESTNDNSEKFTPIVLFWTTYYFEPIPLPTDLYPSSGCLFTNNRTYLPQAHLVIFFLFNLNATDLPPTRHPSQLWVQWYHEPPANHDSFFTTKPVFDGIYFNLTLTYRSDSDLPLPYAKVIARQPPLSTDQIGQMKQTVRRKFETISTTTNGTSIAWLVSNCQAHSKRQLYVLELGQIMPVDIYGRCGMPCETRMDARCYAMLEREYLFYLSFENSLCKDYISEKAFNILHYNLVPIVYGAGNYSHHLPPHSFIDATNKTPHELSEHLLSLLTDFDEYFKYLQWKSHYEIVDTFALHWSSWVKGLTEYISVRALGQVIRRHIKWTHHHHQTNSELLAKPIHNGTVKSVRQFVEWRKDDCVSSPRLDPNM